MLAEKPMERGTAAGTTPADGNFIRMTRSLCPEDLRVLDAELWEVGGQVLMRKACPEHGAFEDI